MLKFFLLLFLFADTEGPVIGKIKYPKPELKMDTDKRIVAILKVKMEIDEYGLVKEFEFLESENIEKNKIEDFFNFFKEQLYGKRIMPMKKNGQPIPCTFIYSFSWILYYPPPEVHYVYSKEKGKKDFLRTLSGAEKEIEIYEKELEDMAINLLNPYGLSIIVQDKITYYTTKQFKEIDVLQKKTINFINYFYEKYSEFFNENLSYEQKIFLFPERRVLTKFLKEEGLPNWADGLYIGPLKLIFAIMPVDDKLMDVYLHEEAHFLINNLLFENKKMPLFLREGFAEYFLFSYKREFYKNEKMERFEEYKKILSKEKIKQNILSYLFFWDSNEPKKEKETIIFYAFSYAFIEYISSKENFLKFIYDIKKDGFSKDNFEQNFGKWKEIEREFSSYLISKY